jgi:hypothetical protein
MASVSRLPEERLRSLYYAEDFGGEKAIRARVIRELFDEIRALGVERADDGHPPVAS